MNTGWLSIAVISKSGRYITPSQEDWDFSMQTLEPLFDEDDRKMIKAWKVTVVIDKRDNTCFAKCENPSIAEKIQAKLDSINPTPQI